MSKIFILAFVIIGTLLLLNIVGFNPPISGFVYKTLTNSTGSTATDLVNYSSVEVGLTNVADYSLWIKILAILSLVGSVGILVGSFTRSPPIEYIIAPFVVIFSGALLADMLYIFTEIWSFGMPYNMIGMLIFGPLVGAYVIAVIEWWRFGI